MRVGGLFYKTFRTTIARPNLISTPMGISSFHPNRPYENLSSISCLAPASWIARTVFTTAWIARATRQDGIGEGLGMSFIWNFAPGMVIDIFLYLVILLPSVPDNNIYILPIMWGSSILGSTLLGIGIGSLTKTFALRGGD